MMANFSVQAQRKTDKLNRGLVVVPAKKGGNLVSWRIQANEYYGVNYNLYRDGILIAQNLKVSNYVDNSGSATSLYYVKPVVDGVESTSVRENTARLITTADPGNPYINITMADVVNRAGQIVFCCCGQHIVADALRQDYSLNDCAFADLDGDGEIEIIVKRINETDASWSYNYDTNKVEKEIYPKTTSAFCLFEAYKLDGTRLWWIDCGPNLVSLNSTELNCVAYDWDQDGKAEVLLRGADNMIIHMAGDETCMVGNMNVNTRDDIVRKYGLDATGKKIDASQFAWTKTGSEYLLYLNGATAKPFHDEFMQFPIERGNLNSWPDADGKTDDYGHRCNKFFFGAPYLDGRTPSIFIARGIYGRTKMVALDVNSNHELTVRNGWPWECNSLGSPWFGQGNHNMSIADVDGDGCDEIVYGSMVIDNNGKGLSTTGLGHGDAIHVGDIDPFRKGLEVFACNEDHPSNNFRNATTSDIYFREGPHYDDKGSVKDDGRAMAGNFSDEYPGCLLASVYSNVISSASDRVITELNNECFTKPWTPMSLNGRIYWDGDLLDEAFDSPGTAKEGVVIKNGSRLFQSNGCHLNNDSKNNPCAQGDILGDWREELVLSSIDNTSLRVYITPYDTQYRIPSLWYDMEYRQAMVWQVCAYNQPPHVSYFMGEMEGLTKVPVPLTMEGRTEITTDGGYVPSGNIDVLVYNKGNIVIPAEGASPRSLIVDVPSVVNGSVDSNLANYGDKGAIYTEYSRTTLSNGSLFGSMNFVKQGDGLLEVPANSTYSYTGNTDVFTGSFCFKGEMKNSPVWMNRHTTLYSNGTFNRAVTMEYGSTLYIGEGYRFDGSDPGFEISSVVMDTLNLHEGSRVVFDIDVINKLSDALNMKSLSIRKRDWRYGPEHLAPVLVFNSANPIPIGDYKLGKVNEVVGLTDATIEGDFLPGTNRKIAKLSGFLYLRVYDADGEEPASSDEEDVSTVLSESKTQVVAWSAKNRIKEFENDEFVTDNNAGNQYALAIADLSGIEGIDDALKVKIEYDTRIGDGNIRFLFGVGDKSVRNENAGGSSKSTYNTDGLFFYYGINGSGLTYTLNGSGDYKGQNKDVHCKFELDRVHKTYSYSLTYDGEPLCYTDSKGSVSYAVAEGIATTIDNATIIEAYSWTNGTLATLNDVTVTIEKSANLTLVPTQEISYTPGIYGTVIVDRVLRPGYSTLCVPFNTTVSEFTNGDSEAYVAYLSGAEKGADGSYTLEFTNVTGIEANQPYIIYLSEELNTPIVKNKPVYSESPKTITVGDWSMTGNYSIMSMEGLYGVANNSKIMKGSSTSTLKGLSAFLTGPSGATVKTRIVGEDVNQIECVGNEAQVVGIYNTSGVRITVPQRGINILRMSNGETRKVQVR